MSYSLWHSGVLMGEADIEMNPAVPRQLVGVIRPTSYGSRVLPRLTGILTAAAALKVEMEERGVSEESITESAVFDLPGGRRMVDLGRDLSEVELRDPSGATLTYQSIAFIDVEELRAVSRKLGCHGATADLESVPAGQPVFLVSTTLAPRPRRGMPAVRADLS